MISLLTNRRIAWLFLAARVLSCPAMASGQVMNYLPGRALAKLLPDYQRPYVYALNSGSQMTAGSLLILNATNGATLGEVRVGTNATDMVMAPTGEALYIINAGSQTVSKLKLDPVGVEAEAPFTLPVSSQNYNRWHLAIGTSNLLYITDGSEMASLLVFDFVDGTNVGKLYLGWGVGGLVANRRGTTLFVKKEIVSGLESQMSYVLRYDASTPTLVQLEGSGLLRRRDPVEAPLFLDLNENRLFDMRELRAAVDVSVLLSSFNDNISAISLDGSVAFGQTQVIETSTGKVLASLPATAVQTLSGDQKRLFRAYAITQSAVPNGSSVVVYDMANIAVINGPQIAPTPADKSVLPLPPAELSWTILPYALAYNVYFGTSAEQVATATTTSPEYFNRTMSGRQSLSRTLTIGQTFYWRVDVVGPNSTNHGVVWSFTISPLSISPPSVNLVGMVGLKVPNPALTLTSSAPMAWSASVRDPRWLTLETTNGTSPANVSMKLNTAGMVVGLYTNIFDINFGGSMIQVPVQLAFKRFNLSKIVADYRRPCLYGLALPASSLEGGQLLFINTDSETLETVLPVGNNPNDVAIDSRQDRLYVCNSSPGQAQVFDLDTRATLAYLPLGPQTTQLNAGRPGRFIIEGGYGNYWASLLDSNGTLISSVTLKPGTGTCDPTGRYYYHADSYNLFANAALVQFDLGQDVFRFVAGTSTDSARVSRGPVLSLDGSRLFWAQRVYEGDLSRFEKLSEEICATTAHGELALGVQHVFAGPDWHPVYTWPFAPATIAVAKDQQKVFLYDGARQQISIAPMSQIAKVAGPGPLPSPPDGSVVSLPLDQVQWTPDPSALSYRVYFGTDQNEIANATTNSRLLLGTVSSSSCALTSALSIGATYYWRLDSVGLRSTIIGPVWTLRISDVSTAPKSVTIDSVKGAPIPSHALSLSGSNKLAWTLKVAQPWLSTSATNGFLPFDLSLQFDHTGLITGMNTNELVISANGSSIHIPVLVRLFSPNPAQLAVDRKRSMIYALQPGAVGVEPAFVLFLNTDTGEMEPVLPIDSNPIEFAVHPYDDRLYIAYSQPDRAYIVDLESRTNAGYVALGPRTARIAAGRIGRMITEGGSGAYFASLLSTMNGARIAAMDLLPGTGICDPTGGYYYHADSFGFGWLRKFDLGNEDFVQVASISGATYGNTGRVLTSMDGSRIFWGWSLYDDGLKHLGDLGTVIFACSTNGSVAFSDRQAFDTTAFKIIHDLPITNWVMAVDRLDRRLWYYDSGSREIENISMHVIRSPSITVPPTNYTAREGGILNLSVEARGFGALAYQWQFAGTNLPMATNSLLSLTNIQASQRGGYNILVSNGFGSVTSAVAYVAVLAPPRIAVQPQNAMVTAGDTGVLSVTAAGGMPFFYQWSYQGKAIVGSTNETLSIANAQSSGEGYYRVVVTNYVGSVTSDPALLRVIPSGPTISTHPASLQIPAGSNAIFSVRAQGSQPMSYQWLTNGTPLWGATTPSLLIANAQAWQAGEYSVIISNTLGRATSSVAALTIIPVPPAFLQQPMGKALPAGTNLTLNALARGTEPIDYQWQQDGIPLPGANQPSLTRANVGLAASGAYDVVAANTLGKATSRVATIVVTGAPPVFVEQPVSATVVFRGTFVLNSRAVGSTPLDYRWYFQGTNLMSQTNRQLILGAISVNAAGPYFVVASNSFGVATSAVARVNVNQAATLQLALTNQIADAGTTVVLAASAAGSAPLTYFWQYNGGPISATGSTLLLNNAQPSQSGFYTFTALNLLGNASSTARLTIFGPASAVKAWGDNSARQTEVPPQLDNAVAVAGGDFHSLALRHDGSLVAWGTMGNGQAILPTNGSRFIAIAAGAAHNLAVTENGSVIAWGRNDAGQTSVPAAAKSVLSVAAGETHSLALLANGTLLAWGDNGFRQASVPTGLSSVRAVAAGRNHNLALRADGTVVGWGLNNYGQAWPPAGLEGVMAISGGHLHSAALRSNGTVVVWGDNRCHQTNMPPGLSNVVAIAAGGLHTFALRSDGLVVGWGDGLFHQIEIPPTVTNATAIASGYYHGLVLVPGELYLRSHLESSALIMEWSTPAILQWSPSPIGPYLDILGADRSYTNSDFSMPSRFFRLRR